MIFCTAAIFPLLFIYFSFYLKQASVTFAEQHSLRPQVIIMGQECNSISLRFPAFSAVSCHYVTWQNKMQYGTDRMADETAFILE